MGGRFDDPEDEELRAKAVDYADFRRLKREKLKNHVHVGQHSESVAGARRGRARRAPSARGGCQSDRGRRRPRQQPRGSEPSERRRPRPRERASEARKRNAGDDHPRLPPRLRVRRRLWRRTTKPPPAGGCGGGWGRGRSRSGTGARSPRVRRGAAKESGGGGRNCGGGSEGEGGGRVRGVPPHRLDPYRRAAQITGRRSCLARATLWRSMCKPASAFRDAARWVCPRIRYLGSRTSGT